MKYFLNKTPREILNALIEDANLDTYATEIVENSLGEIIHEAETDERDEQIIKFSNLLDESCTTLEHTIEGIKEIDIENTLTMLISQIEEINEYFKTH